MSTAYYVKVSTAVVVCLFWGMVFWLMVRVETDKVRQWTWKVQVSPVSPSRKPSRLVYLVQTESCLPGNLKSTVIFRNSTACLCDVVVLSYKQACGDPSPAHVEYISASSPTSWNEGRNLLFEVAKQRKEKYLYYVFMDDDIILQTKAKRKGHPWRIFDSFVRTIEPAVAAVDTDRNPCVRKTYEARKLLGCVLEGTQEYIPAVHYDAAFNAFHYQAVDYIATSLSTQIL